MVIQVALGVFLGIVFLVVAYGLLASLLCWLYELFQ